MRLKVAAQFVGGSLDEQWRNTPGATYYLVPIVEGMLDASRFPQRAQGGARYVERYERAHCVWHDKSNNVLSHFVYRFLDRRDGGLR